ncbi:MAG: hypothetical protein L0332_26180, partial [Chloroflexi bacterium]|nr:hypothetical protein [Chloroflexota bacterium]
MPKLDRILVTVGLLILLSLSVACQGGESDEAEQEIAVAVALTQTAAALTGAQPAATPTAATLPTATLTATSSDPTPSPTVASPTAEPTPIPGGTASFQGVSLTYEGDVAGGAVTGELVARQPGGEGPGHGSGSPETIRLAFPGELMGFDNVQDRTVAAVDIFAVNEYLRLFPAEWEIVEALERMIAERPAEGYGSQFPFLPQPNSSQGFQAQTSYLEFQNGAGVRYITQYAQEPRPVSIFFYTFQGLTADGQYYVSARLPVSTEALPEISEEEFGQLFQDPDQLLAYLEENKALLGGLAASDFSPDLAALDAMMASLLVEPEEFPSPGAPAAEEVASCVYDAEFVTDVTIPDGTQIEPGASFTKVWRIRNIG